LECADYYGISSEIADAREYQADLLMECLGILANILA